MRPKLALVARVVEGRILMIRGQKVLLDTHLAQLYGVALKRLNEQVRRNIKRFPRDFMFKLSKNEYAALRSQFATLEQGRGKHRKYLPYVFTEQGVAMLSSVLNSDRAVAVNIEIMRAFVRLREMLATHKDLARKLEELEKKSDPQYAVVFQKIRELRNPPDLLPERRIRYCLEEPGLPLKISLSECLAIIDSRS